MKQYNILCIFICFLLTLTKTPAEIFGGYSIDTVQPEVYLINSLLSSYNKNQRPTDVVIGYFILKFRRIVSLDEKNQIMTTHSNLNQYWYDPGLAWDANATKINSLYIPAKSIWLPDIYIVNSASTNVWFTINDYQMAHIYHDGSVFLNIPLRSLTTRCEIDIKKYPFDVQKCPITLGSFSQTEDRFYFLLNVTSVDNSSYTTNSLWNLVNITTFTNTSVDRTATYFQKTPAQDLYFSFHIERRPLYFMITGIFPCLVLNLVTLISFSLPYVPQISLSMTAFLTFSVYSLRVQGDIPVQSEYLPMISLYFLLAITFTLVSLIWFIFANMFIEKKNIPKLFSVITNNIDEFCRNKKEKVESDLDPYIEKSEKETKVYEINKKSGNDDDLKKEKEEEEKANEDNEKERGKKIEHQMRILNWIAFGFLLLAMLITNLYIWIFLST